MRRRWLLLPVLLAAATAWGAIYKWVDASGVTHYSEIPPAEGEAREMRLEPGERTPGAAPEAASPVPPQQTAPQPKPGNGATSPEDAAAKREVDATRRMDRCLEARDNLRLLEGRGSVYRIDAQGEQVLLDPAARAAGVEQARKTIERSCTSE